MSRNTTIALAILNAALFAFIMIYERGTLSTSERAGRSGQVLTTFVRDQLERVELVRGDEPPIVLVRERAEDPDEDVLDLGTWTLEAPIEGAVDDDAVDSMLGALEWLTAQRSLTEISDDDRTQFGLAEPRFVVRYRVRDETSEVAFGGAAPTGGGIYVAVAGEPGAHVVGEDIVAELDHDVNHFRSKELLPDFFASDARELEVAGLEQTVRLARADGSWSVTAPAVGWARAGLVEDLLRVLRRARATRFVAEPGADLAEYGLDAPWRSLTGRRAEDVEEHREATLRVGDVCGEHEDERYAVAGDDAPVVCVATEDVRALDLDLDALLETRLLPIGDDAIEKIVLSRGETRIELRRTEGEWELYTGLSDAPGEPSAADDEAIAEWTAQLREARAAELVPWDEGDDHGLGSPRARLTIQRSDRESTVSLRLGAEASDGVWVRRGDENAAVRFGQEINELFAVSALRFRDRRVIEAEPSDAAGVVIRRAGEPEERAARGEPGWALEAPLEADADRVVVGELVRRFAALRAARLVSESASADHGLASPSATIEVRFEPSDDAAEGEPATVTLHLGASAPDGRFGRVGDAGPVFVVGAEDVEALTARLLSRDLLSLVTEDLSTLRVELAGGAHELRREGEAWQLDSGGTPHEARTGALLDRLGTLRAIGVERYGEAARVYPTRVVATRPDGDEVTLSVGAAEGEGAEAWIPMRRAGVDATFRVRPDAVAAIEDFAP